MLTWVEKTTLQQATEHDVTMVETNTSVFSLVGLVMGNQPKTKTVAIGFRGSKLVELKAYANEIHVGTLFVEGTEIDGKHIAHGVQFTSKLKALVKGKNWRFAPTDMDQIDTTEYQKFIENKWAQVLAKMGVTPIKFKTGIDKDPTS